MADRLSCLLIQLSNLAYSIAYGLPASQQPDGVKTVLAETGVIADTLKSFEVGTDACAFAETGGEAILFFRGTLPPWLIIDNHALFLTVIKDWLDDANIALVRGQNLPGRVHQGFLNALDDLWPHIQDFTAGSGKPLYVTGHSKGGGLAFLASYRLAKTGRKPEAVHTFAAPRVGDAAFATAYDTELPETYRVEYRDDLVPHLPPSAGVWLKILEGRQLVRELFPSQAPHLQIGSRIAQDFEDVIARLRALLDRGLNYTSAGTLQFLDWNSPPQILADSLELTWRRALGLAEKAAEFKFVEIIDDHRSDRGYMTSMCPPSAPAA